MASEPGAFLRCPVAGVLFPGETLRASIWKEGDKLLAPITTPSRDDATVLSGVELTQV